MLKDLVEIIKKFPDKNAFCIDNKFYSYADFAQEISNIRKYIDDNFKGKEKAIGITTFDDFETYAAIFAVMFSGLAFVPIDPHHPLERISNIVNIADVNVILTSRVEESIDTIKSKLESLAIKPLSELSKAELNLSLPKVKDSDVAYILFTSGSTGIPKGVPLTNGNIESFIDAYMALGYEINENDRCLQSSDLTFDLSTMSYMVPLSKGACVYTVPSGGIKYASIYGVLEEHEITIALMVPSVLTYLRPYFNDIRLEKMRYSMFCGEALYADILSEWAQCVPNALIQNVYGPTEATNFCLTYDWNKEISKNKVFTGIVSIGKPMKNMEAIVVDDLNNPLPRGEKGELCLTGPQLTTGYLKNPEKNRAAFFTLNTGGKEKTYYKTGDVAFLDEDNDFMFCGRKDYQIKIHGYRIELGEIEHYAREILNNTNVVAIAYQNHMDITQIHLFAEGFEGDTHTIYESLKTKIPEYMLPAGITSLPSFPLNANGKIDRKALLNFLGKTKGDRMIERLTIRQATIEDIPFVIETIFESEKSGSNVISSCKIFELSEDQFSAMLTEVLKQDLENYDYYLSGFIIAELDGEYVGALGSWYEAPDGTASGMIKATVLYQYLDKTKIKSIGTNTRVVKGLALNRDKDTLQLEHGYVREKFRRQGVFSKLLAENIIRNYKRHNGFDKVQGIIFRDNYKSFNAHLKFGYKVVDEKKVDDPEILKFFSYNTKVLVEVDKETILKLLA